MISFYGMYYMIFMMGFREAYLAVPESSILKNFIQESYIVCMYSMIKDSRIFIYFEIILYRPFLILAYRLSFCDICS